MKTLLRVSAAAALAGSLLIPAAPLAAQFGGGACAQVITFARAPEPGSQCQAFPTPCDVPDGWIVCDYPTVGS